MLIHVVTCLLHKFFYGPTCNGIPVKIHCVVPLNIHTYPTEGTFFNTPPPPNPSGNSNEAEHISSIFWVLQYPHPQEILIPSVGEVLIFSECAHYQCSVLQLGFLLQQRQLAKEYCLQVFCFAKSKPPQKQLFYTVYPDNLSNQ